MDYTNDEIKFKYSFRLYQMRILNEVNQYINDGKVHIVAAPGSGKTIIGLQLVFDLKNPALILVPTIGIREQWITRMFEDFCNVRKDIVSTSLKDIKHINVVTYQALYEYKPEDIQKIIIENGIKTIVYDEAHHLRNAWFKHLERITESLEDIKTISLTATPPYDDNKLYKNYIDLCGEIDTEVDVPELVYYKNLCAHQDFIYFNSISENEEKQLESYRNTGFALSNSLINNPLFIKAIATHRYFMDFNDNLTEILNNYTAFIAMTKILMNNGITIPKEINELYIPNTKLSINETEELLFSFLINKDDDFKIISKIREKYRSAFTKIGAINKGNINLMYSKEISKSLTENMGKLDSINEIVTHEYNSMHNNLKLIIVSDYIKNYKTVDEDEVDDANDIQIGVIPIFNNIRTKLPDEIEMIVLTGSIIIIPAKYKQVLLGICEKENIPEDDVQINEYDVDFRFLEVHFNSNAKSVKVITQLFKETDTSVLIGTTALIGEGWDAPFVNTLIIASNVSTYITSNQIRGRVIRTDRKRLFKVANIWHLVTLEKSGSKYLKSMDYDRIVSRFSHIEGLKLTSPELAKGFERFESDIDKMLGENDAVNRLNFLMKDISRVRIITYNSWRKALRQYEKNDSIVLARTPNNRMILNTFPIYEKKLINRGGANSESIIPLILPAGLLLMFFSLADIHITAVILLSLFGYLVLKRIINGPRYVTLPNEYTMAIFNTLKDKKIIGVHSSISLSHKKNVLKIQFKDTDIRSQNIVKKCLEDAFSNKFDTRYMVKCRNKTYNVPSIFDKSKESAEFFLKHLNKKGFKKYKLVFSKGNMGRLERLKLICENLDKDEEKFDVSDLNVDAKVLNDLLGDLDIKIE